MSLACGDWSSNNSLKTDGNPVRRSADTCPPVAFRAAGRQKYTRHDCVSNPRKPSVFISYCRESGAHSEWVRSFADRLLLNDIDVIVDRLSLTVGESTTEFMERAIRSSHFVLMICTPEYKRRSDERQHGVGYEAELMATRHLRGEKGRFIPVLKEGDWLSSLPEWAAGIFGVDLRSQDSDAEFANLLRALKGEEVRSDYVRPVQSGSPLLRWLRTLRVKLGL